MHNYFSLSSVISFPACRQRSPRVCSYIHSSKLAEKCGFSAQTTTVILPVQKICYRHVLPCDHALTVEEVKCNDCHISSLKQNWELSFIPAIGFQRTLQTSEYRPKLFIRVEYLNTLIPTKDTDRFFFTWNIFI